jgi:hypothetical protein
MRSRTNNCPISTICIFPSTNGKIKTFTYQAEFDCEASTAPEKLTKKLGRKTKKDAMAIIMATVNFLLIK